MAKKRLAKDSSERGNAKQPAITAGGDARLSQEVLARIVDHRNEAMFALGLIETAHDALDEDDDVNLRYTIRTGLDAVYDRLEQIQGLLPKVSQEISNG